MFATANPSVGGFDVPVSAIFIGSREAMTRPIRGVLAPVVTAKRRSKKEEWNDWEERHRR
jgi:hypothetical protein